jgi:hypothetical protein
MAGGTRNLTVKPGDILTFAPRRRGKDFQWKCVFLLASQRENTVERGCRREKIPKGIIIVIDVENQL